MYVQYRRTMYTVGKRSEFLHKKPSCGDRYNRSSTFPALTFPTKGRRFQRRADAPDEGPTLATKDRRFRRRTDASDEGPTLPTKGRRSRRRTDARDEGPTLPTKGRRFRRRADASDEGPTLPTKGRRSRRRADETSKFCAVTVSLTFRDYINFCIIITKFSQATCTSYVVILRSYHVVLSRSLICLLSHEINTNASSLFSFGRTRCSLSQFHLSTDLAPAFLSTRYRSWLLCQLLFQPTRSIVLRSN